jgi:hypothetical protein
MPICSTVSLRMAGSVFDHLKKHRNLCLKLNSAATGAKRIWISCRICRSSFNSETTKLDLKVP